MKAGAETDNWKESCNNTLQHITTHNRTQHITTKRNTTRKESRKSDEQKKLKVWMIGENKHTEQGDRRRLEEVERQIERRRRRRKKRKSLRNQQKVKGQEGGTEMLQGESRHQEV